ncbi:MAG: AMP-binding protein [Gemmatimonadaceae bacterium]
MGAAGSAEQYEAQQLVAAGLTLLQRSAPLVRALAGKRSAILLPASPAFITALAASEGRGAVLVNPLAAPAEIAFQCADANVGAIFTTTAFLPRLPQGYVVVLLDDAPRSAEVVAGGNAARVDLGSHHGLSIEGERDVAGSDEEAVIVYTSAMRGTPAGAILTHRNILSNARSVVEALQFTADDRLLAVLPYAHLFGFTVTACVPLLIGAQVTTMERFHPVKAAEIIAGGVTVFIAVPAVYHALLGAIERKSLDITSGALRLCVCGGAVLPRELQDRWQQVTGMELREGYGLTEAGPVALVNRPDLPNVPGTLGVALEGMDVEIKPPADDASIDGGPIASLPDGAIGEICVRGDNVFPGYVGGADGLPVRDGWLYTGDRGVRAPSGHITFLGLIKPMFTRNGFNVYPRELERVIGAMPGVTAVHVEPIPDPAKENDILVRITGNVSEEDVRGWCELKLSAYKQPTVIELAAG